jgi:DNA-3-methyladenine glycosylase II
MSIVNKKDCIKLFKIDPVFADIHARYGEPPNWSRPPGFISLSKIILEQQVSLASAKAHFEKLNGYISEFTPQNILQLTDEEMRSCQISRQKAKYLKALSNAIQEKEIDLDALSKMDEEEIRTQLTQIKGIGQWTSDIYLMFCLQSRDIFPIGDIAVVNTVKELIGAQTREQITELAEKWQPLRSLAAYFLWHYYLRKRHRT